jgi:hypothetical protein
MYGHAAAAALHAGAGSVVAGGMTINSVSSPS